MQSGLPNITTIKADSDWEKIHESISGSGVDGTRARFFTLSPMEFDAYEARPDLIEHDTLHNAEKEMPGQDLWAKPKTERNQGRSGQAHSYDDHRSNHLVEFERRFAQAILS